MNLERIPPAFDAPHDFNVVIEIPAHADPVKFEVDKTTGALFVDRFMLTAMHYPCNYGFVPNTLSDDGDPLDVLVITPFPLISGVVVRCRPLGVLMMEDESGQDEKILAVPINKVLPIYKKWQDYRDVAPENIQQIEHFFSHYKDLEAGKWVKISRWESLTGAEKIILEAIEKGKSQQA